LIALNAAMAFGGLLLSVTTDPVYSFYSVNGHNEAGSYMLITCILLLAIGLPAYLRNTNGIEDLKYRRQILNNKITTLDISHHHRV
jgi:hypothetical protein